METLPHVTWTVVFWSQRYRRNSNGVTSTGAPNAGGLC